MKQQYGDYRVMCNEPETIKEKLDFIRNAVDEMMQDIWRERLEPDLDSIKLFVKTSSSMDGPFCTDETGEPVKWRMTVGIKFDADLTE